MGKLTYSWVTSVMRKSLREKIAIYDAAKDQWDSFVKQGEANLKHKNGEQADAYFQKALDMEIEILRKLSDLIRIRDLIMKAEISQPKD
jgi:hypothetical protein